MTATDVRPGVRRGRRWSEWPASVAARWPWWLQVAAIYLALRALSWLLLHEAADQQHFEPQPTYPQGPGAMTGDPSHESLTLNWDAQWYERIAEHGYPDHLPVYSDGTVQQNEWAFYPVFPYAARLVMSLTGFGFATVGPALALIAGLGAALVMAKLFRDTLDAGTGRLSGAAVGAVAVWAALPSAPALQMAYTEAFAMLLLVSYLLLVVHRQWWGAGLVALVLGLTRPIALPLTVVALVSAWLRWREGRLGGREAAGLAFTVVATGLSGLLWTAVAWWGTGRRDAYPATMSSWRYGEPIHFWKPWQTTLEFAWKLLRGQSQCTGPGCERVFVVPAVCIVLAVGLSALALLPWLAGGVDIRLRVWSAAYAVYLLAVVDGGTSIVRYLLPLFPLALVLVGAHRRRGGRWLSPHWRWRTAFWVAAGIVGQVGWIWWLVVFSPLPTGGDYPP